jgi:ATP-dependent Lhr-like helicase
MLSLFLPPVAAWFERTLGAPTPVQEQGWPVILAGKHTLLLAPTGSGKTLAAFLACLDHLWRQRILTPGVRILYVSPLKALNNDIHRNLQFPLQGIERFAAEMGFELPHLTAAVRTGDTPVAERQRLVRKPPHILITTPESLHLLLTSQARATLRSLTHVIVDEIHALCPNKRGVFLALLLERLQELNPNGFVRIGLSATQRPLDEVARYLGGADFDVSGTMRERPVTIVDAGLRKQIDLQVVCPVEQFGAIAEKTVWPSIYRLLAREIEAHRSTIVFANNRRSVERLTAMLNEEFEGRGEPIQVRSHHGSVSLEVRQQTEQALKEGRLRAVAATASLELGIDMGSVDLVCQVESPGSVSRALQRVGRAGHLVGQQSKGRLIPKTLPDLLNQAVLAAEMLAGRVEPMHVPRNCLDVLAQQIVAMVAMESWQVEDLYRLVRRAYPFRDLTPQALDAVLEMISGRFRFNVPLDTDEQRRVNPATQLRALQARISWDRVHQRLHALPGSQRLALTSGGTIPDTGQYPVVTSKGVRIGELDEEFIYERRIGDTFLLGTTAWKIDRIEVDRVLVHHAEGTPAMVPFWRGEQAGRSYDLGLAQGRFLRELTGRLGDAGVLDWLQREHRLDCAAARNLRDFVLRQELRAGCVPSERTFLIEASHDPLGDWQVLFLSPLGARFHFTLRLAIENRLRERLGYRPQCLHDDDGILIRLTESDEPVLDILAGVSPENLQTLVLEELADSALFALRFRQNAARALLMPRGQATQRAPLWLQRLRGRDLLQVARRYPDFPIVAETFRECLADHLDIAHVAEALADIERGERSVIMRRLDTPSPFASTLLFQFQAAYMYVFNVVDAEPTGSGAKLDPAFLEQLAGTHMMLDPLAVQHVDQRLRGVGMPPRSPAEMAEWLRRLGDVAPSELEGPMREHLASLEREGRVQSFELANVRDPQRWILTELVDDYRAVFRDGDAGAARHQAALRILHRYLETHALVGLDDLLARYPFEPAWAREQLQAWQRQGRIVSIPGVNGSASEQYAVPDNLQRMRRGTLAMRRREVIACPPRQFVDFVLRWQKLHPIAQVDGADGTREVLGQLNGQFLPVELVETSILPGRVRDYHPRWLDAALSGGTWLWMGRGANMLSEVAFIERERLVDYAPPPLPNDEGMPAGVEPVYQHLQRRGALFVTDLAVELGLAPSTVRTALGSLACCGLATNDLYDVVRRGEPIASAAPAPRSRMPLRPRASARRPLAAPEGRWSLLKWGQPDLETQALAAVQRLLDRYGVVSREIAALDECMPAWRILYEILSRLELSDAVRRGYFVEGLSGAQFALPEASRMLQELTQPSTLQAPMLLVPALDPANLFGTVFALHDMAWARRLGNAVVVQAGMPILVIEQHGRKLSSVPGVRDEQLAEASKLLPRLLPQGQHKLVVETWDGAPSTVGAGRTFLESAGFVRDYQSMTYYARVS